MKYTLFLLTLIGFSTGGVLHAEDTTAENNDTALTELCNTYAEEDGIIASKKSAYLQKCLKSMSDLTESMQENLPLAADQENSEEHPQAAASVVNTPEKLVQSELVETPDPSAEQLSAVK